MDEALIKKLRLPADGKVAVIAPPEGFLESIGRPGADTTADKLAPGGYDFVQAFLTSAAEADRLAPVAIAAAKRDALLWLCYPKGTSKAKTDLNRDKGWDTVSSLGWEGVSLISIDETWSAMRFRPIGAGGPVRSAGSERRARAASTASAAPLEVPEDLAKALASHPSTSEYFDKLAPSHRKEYINWIVEAKREETRTSRIAKTVEKLSARLERPSDK
ncbi:MAG: YdeI/OmpD-associated family protein [Cohnella sp.]|nr:YdeI/OmpD-associated family protein [Cohnella sp.]